MGAVTAGMEFIFDVLEDEMIRRRVCPDFRPAGLIGMGLDKALNSCHAVIA